MGFQPNKELFAKNSQIVEVKAIYCCMCGNCNKPFAFEQTIDVIDEDEIKKTWNVCPHCDYENTLIIERIE
jgi:DNA-directed RNA polymerase subunit RPC12/RpoP